MKIEFDDEGITSSCPVADAGLKSFEECKDCEYFLGSSHFDVECNYEEIEPRENRMKEILKYLIPGYGLYYVLTRGTDVGVLRPYQAIAIIVWQVGVIYTPTAFLIW